MGPLPLLILVYLLTGALAGTLAGLFGVGGGTIIVPALLLCFTWQDFQVELKTHLAIGTSLACILVTSLSSTRTHHRKDAVRWPLVKWLSPGIAIGVWLGAGLATQLHGLQLQRLFGLFAWIVALQMWTGWQPGARQQLPSNAGLSLAGLIIGGASSLFGIGGGSLTVPFLVWCRVRMQEAVGTAAACGFPIALIGTAAYIYQGQAQPNLPVYAIGFIYLPALFGIGITSLPFATLGAKLAHRWPETMLKQLFAGFLLLIGTALLIGIR
jgi:hypothetical protein